MKIEPRRYRARFIEPGVISYEDIGMGLVMVGRTALDRMRSTFVGMPVFNLVHKDVEADEAFDFENATRDNMAVGIISGVGTGEDGWDWADMMIWDPETQTNIEDKGFTVSCAYDTIQSGPPGKHNGIAFDEEVLDGKYVHMAIVNNPRYEGSTVIRNSKGGPIVAEKTKKGWSWSFTKKNAEEPEKKAPPAPDPKTDEKVNALDEGLSAEVGEGAYMVIDGQKVPIEELLELVEGHENAEAGAVAPEDEITAPSGNRYTGNDLIAAYKAKAEPPAPKVEEPNEMFQVTKKNAQAAAEETGVRPVTKTDRYEVGKQRYGSAVAGGK